MRLDVEGNLHFIIQLQVPLLDAVFTKHFEQHL